MHRHVTAFAFLTLIAVLLVGCGSTSGSAQDTPAPRPTVKATATRTPSPTPEPTDVPTNTPAPTPRPKPAEPTRVVEPTAITGDQSTSWPKTDLLAGTTWSTTDQSYYQDGRLHIESNSDGQYWKTWTKVADFGDFIYEMEVTKTKGPDNYGYGMVFQVREAADEFVLFEITGSGSYRVDFSSKGKWTSLTEWTDTDALRQGNSFNKLKVAVMGDKAQFYINDLMVTDLKITPGRGYVGAYSGQKGLHIVVSLMDVYAPK